MDDNVVNLFDPELSADDVLERAKGKLGEVLIIGYDHDGVLDVRSTNTTAANAAFMTQQFLSKLYNGDYRDE